MSLQPLTYSPTGEPAEVREEKQLQQQKEEQEEKDAAVVEQERVHALLQRKKLVQELGVVEQLRQLLQGHTAATAGGGEKGEGAGVLQDTSSQQQSKQAHQRQQPTKVTTKNGVKFELSRVWFVLFKVQPISFLFYSRWTLCHSFTRERSSSSPVLRYHPR